MGKKNPKLKKNGSRTRDCQSIHFTSTAYTLPATVPLPPSSSLLLLLLLLVVPTMQSTAVEKLILRKKLWNTKPNTSRVTPNRHEPSRGGLTTTTSSTVFFVFFASDLRSSFLTVSEAMFPNKEAASGHSWRNPFFRVLEVGQNICVQTDARADGQTDRQTDKQTDTKHD